MKKAIKLFSSMFLLSLLGGLLTACDPSNQEVKSAESSEVAGESSKKTISAYEKAYEKFDRALTEKMSAEGIPSASVAVREKGKEIHSQTYGEADKVEQAAVTKNTMFSTGSVSKVYVAAAALKLAEEGLLDLDAKVTEYIPDFKMADSRYETITVRMLLNHTSGMPGDASAIDCDWAGKVGNNDFFQNTLKELANQTLKSEPGKSANYCNSGFVLAQKVIEAIAEKSFGEYLLETFFKPMGLENTVMSSDVSVSPDRVARPVDLKGNMLPKEYIGASADGLGGMAASPSDVANFVEQILSPKSGYLNQESIDLFRSDQSSLTNLPNEQLNNGLGWDRISPEYPETQVFEKAGGTTNYASKVLSAPDAGLTVAGSITQLNMSFTELLDELMHDLLVANGTVIEKSEMPTLPEERTDMQNISQTDYYYSNDNMFANAGIKKAEVKDNVLTLSSWEAGEWNSIGQFNHREDDTFGHLDEHSDEYTGYSFKEVSGITYLMKTTTTPNFSHTEAVARKIEVDKTKEPSKAWQTRNNSLWLRTNINPIDYQAFACISSIELIQELNGYVLTNGAQPLMEIENDEIIKEITDVPGAYYPDARVVDDKFIQMGMEFVPASEAQPLKSGKNAVNFEKENTAKWFVAPAGMTISTKVNYQEVRIVAYDLETGLIHDNIGDNEDFEVPEGSYVMMTSAKIRDFDFQVK